MTLDVCIVCGTPLDTGGNCPARQNHPPSTTGDSSVLHDPPLPRKDRVAELEQALLLETTRANTLEQERKEALEDNASLGESLAACDERRKEAEREVATLRAQLAELGNQLEVDRTRVADCLTAANREIDSRHWLTEGRGSYEWNDDRWHNEFREAAPAIKAALEPMTKIARNWVGCPVTADAVIQARIDQKARAEAAEAALTLIEQRILPTTKGKTWETAADGVAIVLKRMVEAEAAYAEALGALRETLKILTKHEGDALFLQRHRAGENRGLTLALAIRSSIEGILRKTRQLLSSDHAQAALARQTKLRAVVDALKIDGPDAGREICLILTLPSKSAAAFIVDASSVRGAVLAEFRAMLAETQATRAEVRNDG